MIEGVSAMAAKKDKKKQGQIWRPATRLVHEGTLRSQFGETSEAIFLNSGYVYDNAEQAERRFKGDEEGFVYSRYSNPTVDMFEKRMCALEGAESLEAVLLTPTKVSTILFSLTLWNLILSTIDLLIYIALALFLFKVDFAHVNPLSTAVVFCLSITSFSALGILSASFIMVFKQGNPLGWLLGSLEGLIGGVYFPVTVLPAWMQFIAGFSPITYAVKAVQLAVYKGYSLGMLRQEIGLLLLFSVTLLPLSLAAFRFSLRKARRDGSLGQY
jgi:ABC-2 type transport system permease protein